MKFIILPIFILLTILSDTCFSGTITSLSLVEKDGVTTNNYPLTFAHVFKQGDVTGNVYLNNYPTQTDVKTTWPDGSIRHAVISALVPVTANQTLLLNINDTGIAADSTPISKTAMLATDVGATIDLSNLSGSGHSGTLQADLRAAINSASSFNYWLSGSVVSEILINDRLSNSLNVTWEVRFYPGTSYIRISHAMENIEANYRGDVNYSVSIKHGNSSPSEVYSKATFKHNAMARWRKVFWLGASPPEVEIHYDTNYLISTGHIPSYNTALVMPESAIAGTYSSWLSKDTDIMGDGLQDNGFASGEEGSILQKYAVQYLLSWDNRLREVVLGMGEVTASCPIHYREYDETKTFYGHTLSIDDRPSVRTNYLGSGLPSKIDETTSQWTVDQAHQWSYNYLPYLITGERWYLDELYHWAGWNMTYQNPAYRDYANGILPVSMQVRGIAWAYRTMVQAAAIAPDADIEKAYFTEKIGNNITRFVTESTVNPLRHMYNYTDPISGLDASVTDCTSGWMQDFLVLALTHGGDLGFDPSAVLAEFSKFTINRFHHPDFNWYNGATYRFPVATTSGPVQTWAEASSLFTSQPTSFDPIGYSYSYRHKALAALSQLTKYAGGQDAYDWLLTNFTAGTPPLDEQYAIDPTWAIVPRVLNIRRRFPWRIISQP